MTVTVMCPCIMLPWWEPEWVHRREQQTGRGTPWLSLWCVPVSCYLGENQSEYTEESSKQEEEPHDWHLDVSCIMLPWWEPEWVHRREQQTGRGTPWLSPWCILYHVTLVRTRVSTPNRAADRKRNPMTVTLMCPCILSVTRAAKYSIPSTYEQ